MDYATRYPEAAPMKSIEAERVAEELVTMFTRLGIPRARSIDLVKLTLLIIILYSIVYHCN